MREKEQTRLIDKEKEREASERKLEKENTIVSINQDIIFVKDSIKNVEETIREANNDIAKALKGPLKKDNIHKSHTLIEMSLDKKRALDKTLDDLESKKTKLI